MKVDYRSLYLHARMSLERDKGRTLTEKELKELDKETISLLYELTEKENLEWQKRKLAKKAQPKP